MNDSKKNSLSLIGTLALGTGVMIGAGIFALLGQIAELSGEWFPYIFLGGAVIAGFSSYSYIKVCNVYPSSGGIAMILQKAYGKTTITAWAAVLMALSMVINESLVARTFGTYTLQLFDVNDSTLWVPLLGVGLLLAAFVINLSGNEVIGKTAQMLAFVKIGGIVVFAIGAIWASGFALEDIIPKSEIKSSHSIYEYVAALALSILAYKGFTTITNSGGEVKDPKKNVGKAIMLSILICTVVYFLVAIGVSSSLNITEIINARDYSLAEASRPIFGEFGLYFTVGIAIIATVGGVIASIFAVSRMTAMLTDMELVPHNSFGMNMKMQKQMLVYIVAIAILLTIFLDLSRIASVGAIFYIVMDIVIHWGVFKNIRKEIDANPVILIIAITLDIIVLLAFLWVKFQSDSFVVYISTAGVLLVFGLEYWFLNAMKNKDVAQGEGNNEG